MSSDTRMAVSKKNPYWIDKERRYELKHFCLQYGIWRSRYLSLSERTGLGSATYDLSGVKPSRSIYFDEMVTDAMTYRDRCQMIEDSATETDGVIGHYILRAVTEDLGYNYLRTALQIPCCKDEYYILLRKFFWILDKKRE